MRRILCLLGLVVLGLLAAAILAPAAKMPAVGSMAPDFTLPSQEGTPVRLSDYQGKWVVLYFYPKDFTSGCTREAHDFQRDLVQYQQRNAVILGVSLDSVDSHKQFCAKEGLNFKLLSDSDKKVAAAYGSLTNLGIARFASRHTFLIDPSGRIARAYASVDPGKHSQEVLGALDELQKPHSGAGVSQFPMVASRL